jgi:Disulphide bond corrector protein DsbC
MSEAQSSIETVHWTVSIVPAGPVSYGSTATLELSGDISEGWHVYALTQPQGGPTALRITLGENDAVRLAGTPSGTVPEKKHDSSFDLETQFYTHEFALRVPVQMKHPAAGRQLIPIRVRFQSCSDKECLPPRTVLFSVPIEVLPKGAVDRESPRT